MDLSRIAKEPHHQSSHPGPYIREKIIPKGMSVREAADLLDVGRPALSNLLNGNAALSPEMALKLQTAFGASAQELTKMQAVYDRLDAQAKSDTATTRTFVPPFLEIGSLKIEAWSKSNSARNRLAVLLRILVHSTGRKLQRVDFPGNDEAQRRGWDGFVEAEEGAPWIPQGKSGWEFGCEERPEKKAESDYEQRLKQDEAARRATTFVFVTPKRWPGKDRWADEKRKTGAFKNVRALDASDLEQWLEQSIPGQVWFSFELGNNNDGVASLDEVWAEWLADCTPPLPKTLFKSAVSVYAKVLFSRLDAATYTPIKIAADSTIEALAFLACAFEQNDAERAALRDRVVVFSKPDAIGRLVSNNSSLIAVITTREAERAFARFSRSVRSIIIYPKGPAITELDITLEPLGYDAWSEALTDMGFDRDNIDLLARETGKSPTILRRRRSALDAVRKPIWAGQDEIADSLAPLAFAGAWQAENNADQFILCELTRGRSFETVEKSVTSLRALDDPPVWSIGSFRGICSKIDALYSIAHRVTAADIERFLEIAHLVLSEDNPALDLPEDSRWAASVYGKRREISAALRDSIAESVVLLSVHGNDLFKSTLGIDCEQKIRVLIERLLKPLNARRLEAQGDDLPMYAEAAPGEFLEIIEEDLKKPDSAIIELLRPVKSGVFGGCPRTGILWALEGLAWYPEFLSRVCLILARMSEVPIDDNWSNKPINSLGAIFRSWMPQTTVPLDGRIEALRTLIDRCPESAWKICVEQFDSGHRFGNYSHKPRWRLGALGAGEPVTNGEMNKFAIAALEFALNWRKYDKDTLGDLVNAYPDLPEEFKRRIEKIIRGWIESLPTDEERAALREAIRVNALNPRSRPIKGRKSAGNIRLKEIFDALEPVDPIQKHAWLFRKAYVSEAFGEIDEDYDFKKRDRKIENLRITALNDIFVENGLGGLGDLAEIEEASQTLGYLIPKVFNSESDLTHALLYFWRDRLELDSFRRLNIAAGILAAVDVSVRSALIAKAQIELTQRQYTDLLVAAPFDADTWRAVERMDDVERNFYWTEVRPQWWRQPIEDVKRGIAELIGVNRPAAAFYFAHLVLEELSPELLYRILDAMASSPESEPRFQLERYSINKAFSIVDESKKISTEQMARLEFQYVGVLERGDHGIPNLEREIERHPGLFAQAIAFAFRRDDDGVDPDEWKTNDRGLASNRALAAMKLLDRLKRTPGMVDGADEIDERRFKSWFYEAREHCASLGRLRIAEQKIGELLARSPVGRDQIWPCEAVRETIEEVASKDISVGLFIGTYNSRGVHWRGDDGAQERDIAAKFQNWSDQLRMTHPYVSKALSEIAASYVRDAEREDTDASIRKRLRY